MMTRNCFCLLPIPIDAKYTTNQTNWEECMYHCLDHLHQVPQQEIPLECLQIEYRCYFRLQPMKDY